MDLACGESIFVINILFQKKFCQQGNRSTTCLGMALLALGIRRGTMIVARVPGLASYNCGRILGCCLLSFLPVLAEISALLLGLSGLGRDGREKFGLRDRKWKAEGLSVDQVCWPCPTTSSRLIRPCPTTSSRMIRFVWLEILARGFFYWEVTRHGRGGLWRIGDCA